MLIMICKGEITSRFRCDWHEMNCLLIHIWCIFVLILQMCRQKSEYFTFHDFCVSKNRRFLVQKHCFKPFLVGKNFHICVRSGPRGLTPPPYGQPDRKISVFTTPVCMNSIQNLTILLFLKAVKPSFVTTHLCLLLSYSNPENQIMFGAEITIWLNFCQTSIYFDHHSMKTWSNFKSEGAPPE